MSQRELDAIIGRTVLDQESHIDLFATTAMAPTGHEVTAVEMMMLKSVDAERLNGWSRNMERRVASGLPVVSSHDLLPD
jgi:hypothetical protein